LNSVDTVQELIDRFGSRFRFDRVMTPVSIQALLPEEGVAATAIAGSTGSALRAVRPPNLHITP